MRITEIRVDGLRNLRAVEIRPDAGFNFLIGRNGAGKSSVIEALHLLAHGRSFRSGSPETLIRHGESSFSTFVWLRHGSGRERSLGMQRSATGWVLRNNEQPVSTLIDFVRTLAVVTLEPESHQLLTGPSEGRRRFLDWLLFHVEPDFLGCWRRYLRALRQRNAALRAGHPQASLLSAWETEMASAGERIDQFRRQTLDQIAAHVQPLSASLLTDIQIDRIHYRAGWPAGMSLRDALLSGRASDQERGFSQRGPHRSDWRLEFTAGTHQGQLSRGQTKLAALTCLLAQAALFTEKMGDSPVYACDDLASELDARHQALLLQHLAATGAQVFITGTEARDDWTPHVSGAGMFHVEQGQIGPLL